MKTTKTVYVNSCEKTMIQCQEYARSLVKAIKDCKVPGPIVSYLPRASRGYIHVKTPQINIFIFPTHADMTGRRPVDEAFYFDAETAKYLYGKRYSKRYGGWLIDYIVEVEGGLPRPENDGKEFIHEYDT